MAITDSDLLRKYSGATTPGNTNAQTDPDASLGGFMATSQITSGASHNLFDAITGLENAAEDVEYRCEFIHNNHGTLTLQDAVAWISDEDANGADIAIGLDPTGVVDADSASAQAVTVANENTAPSGVTFTAPTTQGTGLAIGDIPADDCQAIWWRRTANDTAAVSGDDATVTVQGDTDA